MTPNRQRQAVTKRTLAASPSPDSSPAENPTREPLKKNLAATSRPHSSSVQKSRPADKHMRGPLENLTTIETRSRRQSLERTASPIAPLQELPPAKRRKGSPRNAKAKAAAEKSPVPAEPQGVLFLWTNATEEEFAAFPQPPDREISMHRVVPVADYEELLTWITARNGSRMRVQKLDDLQQSNAKLPDDAPVPQPISSPAHTFKVPSASDSDSGSDGEQSQPPISNPTGRFSSFPHDAGTVSSVRKRKLAVGASETWEIEDA